MYLHEYDRTIITASTCTCTYYACTCTGICMSLMSEAHVACVNLVAKALSSIIKLSLELDICTHVCTCIYAQVQVHVFSYS